MQKQNLVIMLFMVLPVWPLREKLSVKTIKGSSIEYYKKNNHHTMKYIGRSKVFKISKKCKYYTTISGTTKLVWYKKVRKIDIYWHKKYCSICDKISGFWRFCGSFQGKKGYVTKIMMVYS